MNKKVFLESLKIEQDIEKEKLISIQNKISENMTKENIIQLTKNLSESEKERLKELYIKQIKTIDEKTQKCKEKILRIKSNAAI